MKRYEYWAKDCSLEMGRYTSVRLQSVLSNWKLLKSFQFSQCPSENLCKRPGIWVRLGAKSITATFSPFTAGYHSDLTCHVFEAKLVIFRMHCTHEIVPDWDSDALLSCKEYCCHVKSH